MSRVLRYLLILGLVPVLVIASAVEPAAAVRTAGSTVYIHIDSTNNPLNQPRELVCDITARWVTEPGIGPGTPAPVSAIDWSANCFLDWDYAGAQFEFVFIGDGASGLPCVVHTETYEWDGSPNHSGETNWLTGTVVDGVPTAVECAIQSVCVSGHFEWHSGPDGDDVHCEDIATMENPPEPYLEPTMTGTCNRADIERPTFAAPRLITTSSYRQQASVVTFEGSFTGVSDAVTWIPYVLVQSNDGINANWNQVSGGTAPSQSVTYYPTNSLVVPLQVGIGSWDPGTSGQTTVFTAEMPMSKRNTWVSGVDPPVGGVIIGMGVVGDRGMTLDWKNTPQAHANGKLGVSDPNGCSFYWGAKVATTANNDYDEPLGPLTGGTTPPPDPDPLPTCDPGETGPDCTIPEGSDECNFSLTDPSTWAGGGICQLVKLISRALNKLGEIATTLAGLAANIVSGILDGLGPLLQQLFVPSPGAWGFDELRDTFLERPPGSIISELAGAVTAFGDGYSSANAACSSVINVQIPGPDESVNSCEVAQSTGLSAVYSIVQLALVSLTAFGAFHIVKRQIAS